MLRSNNPIYLLTLRTSLAIFGTLLFLLIIHPWSLVNGIGVDQTETSLIVTQSGEDLIFAGDTMANANVTIQVWPGMNCWTSTPITLTTHSSYGGTYKVTVSKVQNGQFPAGTYSAYAFAVTVGPGLSMSVTESGCIYFYVSYPVLEFSEVPLTIFTTILSLATIIKIDNARRKQSLRASNAPRDQDR